MQLDAEDDKLVALARAAGARVGSRAGAAVRDGDGRSYASAAVQLPSLTLTALQLAVAQAVAAGAQVFEAAVIVSDAGVDDAGIDAFSDVASAAPVYLVSSDAITRVRG